MTDPNLPTRTEGEGETLDMPEGMETFAPGQVLGERYQILEMLGRGGMGEVWHAFDLKLRVEVALKALREDLFKSERRLELLRQEVRAAREVVSPNVCRIFDLIEVEGRELVSMEYVDGATLLGVLQERGPLELKEAQDIASQVLAGLEAIHKVGLVHRDIKPENIMLTRAGRVVVMDFGLARQEAEGGGSVSGTPAYMAPEQAAGQTLDARADVFSAGVVLAEMVSPDGIKSYETRQSLWEGVRSEPAKLPDSPWAPAIKKAVARDRERRFNTAHTLVRALEDVTLRVEGADDLHPYPGLASFAEGDAEYFFGREAEVEQMWRKLEGPPRLFAIMGPSGAGKSSFIAAGLVAHAPPNWGIIRSTPGNAAISSLAGVVARETAGDPDAVELLPRFDDPDIGVEVFAHWGRKQTRSLLVVDQFEELFTQNSAEEQRRLADLLHRFVVEANIHVLLSMRDDFAAACNAHESLRPIFHELTVLDPPTGANLRRAMTQPAQKCGYRFEDDQLLDEMLAEVEGERGALPLLAFAAARLWEKRDRETGLLTRKAHHDIGGVGGALARHAEATIDRIGTDHIAIVRELFRNLVTAEGTRAVREWDELLSIFSDSQSESQAEEVLRQLIDARLLTSYETREGDEAPTRRVEIIHESLIANWPRLVRWQTQDEEGAQLRDELRQAARSWNEHGRQDDRLWTGTAFREHQLWRERYPGGLTQLEEVFASAMTSLATRRKRRRRAVVAAAFILLIAVLAVVGTLWQRSVLEARRAEAAKLLTLAQLQLQLEDGPTEALAYATSSLELADTPEARVFALRALWAAPPARVLPAEGGAARVPSFSPDGRWLAAAGHFAEVLVWPEAGGDPIRLPGHTVSPRASNLESWSENGYLVTRHFTDPGARIWSIPEGRLVRTIELPPTAWWQVGEKHLFAEISPAAGGPLELRRWQLPDGEPEDLGSVDVESLGITSSAFDPSGGRWIFTRGATVYSRALPLSDDDPGVVVGRHDHDASCWVKAHEVWSADQVTGELRCWSLDRPSPEPLALIPPHPGDGRYLVRDLRGRWSSIYGKNAMGATPELWYLDALPGAGTLALRRAGGWNKSRTMAIHPAGTWMATSCGAWDSTVFYPLTRTYPVVADAYREFFGSQTVFAFSPDGAWMAQPWGEGSRSLRLLHLRPTGHNDVRLLPAPVDRPALTGVAFDPAGERLLRAGLGTDIWIVPVDGSEPRNLEGFSNHHMVVAAFSPSGRLVAAATLTGTAEPKVMRVWDLETGAVRVFDLEPPWGEGPRKPKTATGVVHGVNSLAFTDESILLTAGADGVRRWDLATGTFEVVVPTQPDESAWMFMSADRGTMLTLIGPFGPRLVSGARGVVHDLKTGASREVDLDPDCGAPSFAIDSAGEILAESCEDGSIHVGRIGNDFAHLLLGHEGPVPGVGISPDGAWIASAGDDGTLRLWPMPDLDKPPLHALPHDELIAKLHTLTNLRVVRDEASSTGWKIEVGPFPGWETVPTW